MGMHLFNEWRKKSLGLVLIPLVFAACGGSTATTTTTDDTDTGGEAAEAEVLSVTGTINKAGVGSSSLSAKTNGLQFSTTSVPAESAAVTLYTLAGDTIGTATTDINGDFTVSITATGLATIKEASGADADTTEWSLPIVVDSEDTGIGSAAEITITEGTTTTVDVGDATPLTTLSLHAIAADIEGFSGWGVNYIDQVAGKDLKCIFIAQHTLWEDASMEVGNGGMSTGNAILRETMTGFMAAGKMPEDVGYTNWSDMMQAMLNGDLAEDTDKLSTIATYAAEGNPTLDHDVVMSGYGDASASFGAIKSVFSQQFASGGLGTTGATALGLRAETDESDSGDLCSSLKDGTMDPDALIRPMLVVDDVASFTQTYGNTNGFAIHVGLLEQCKQAADCDKMINKPAAYYGFMDSFDGEFGAVYADGVFDTTELEGFSFAAGSCSGSSREEVKTCAEGMHGMVYANSEDGHGGWDNFKGEEGNFDAAQFESWGGYWTTQTQAGFDPDNIGEHDTFYGEIFNEIGPAFQGGGATQTFNCVDAIKAEGSVDFSSCYQEMSNVDDFDGWQGGSIDNPSAIPGEQPGGQQPGGQQPGGQQPGGQQPGGQQPGGQQPGGQLPG